MGSKSWPVNFYSSLSFLYWYVRQEGSGLAENGVWSSITGLAYLTPNTTALVPKFDYAPGFKAALGIVGNHQWDFSLEYTWLRGSTSISEDAPSSPIETAGASIPANPATAIPVWIIDDWFIQGTTNNQALSGTHISSRWKHAVDFLDLMASRPLYEGPSLSITPFAGLRAARIRESLRIAMTLIDTIFPGVTTPQPIISHNLSQNWGIGPKIGLTANGLFAGGFRLEGKSATSILWTRYTKVTHSEDVANTTFNPGPYLTSIRNHDCVRVIAEAGLGLGWGKYFSSGQYHIDFSADYDFTFLWRQNMMRLMSDLILTGTGAAASDLFMHGLTVTGRFDF